jgi:superfamily II DNA/RNA helicase
MNTNFTDFDLPEALSRGLDKLGFSEPTPVQRLVIPLANRGSDLLVTAATGSGKTIAFLLPMMRRFLAQPAPRKGIRALILAPTRELAYQIQEHFLQIASFTRLTAGVIVGGVSASHQVASLRRNPDLSSPRRAGCLTTWSEGRRTSGTWRCWCWMRRIGCWTWASPPM